MSSKVKNLIILLVIGAGLIALYLYFFSPEPDGPTLVTDDGMSAVAGATPSDMSQGTGDLLPVLLNVRNIELNDAIFADDAFLTLRDSSITLIPDGTEGRPNPFAPFGTDNQSAASNWPAVNGGGTTSNGNSTTSSIPFSAEEASAANTIDLSPTLVP